MKEIKFAPKEVFETLLEWAVIPTFDLVIQYKDKGYIVVKRTIAPYKDQWALPGLRMYKGESIIDTLKRIAQQEVGLTIDPKEAHLLGQFVGNFKTEHERQDLSTGYVVKYSGNEEIVLNAQHFSSYKLIDPASKPEPMGAMYKYYLNQIK